MCTYDFSSGPTYSYIYAEDGRGKSDWALPMRRRVVAVAGVVVATVEEGAVEAVKEEAGTRRVRGLRWRPDVRCNREIIVSWWKKRIKKLLP